MTQQTHRPVRCSVTSKTQCQTIARQRGGLWLSLGLSLWLVACSGNPEVTAPAHETGEPDAGQGASGGRDGGIHLGQGGVENPPPPPTSICGNGKLEPGEVCDDGGKKDGDGCSANCRTQNPEFDCSTPGKPCIDTVVCGDGVLQGTEVCDDGGTSDGDGCSANCSKIEAGYSCPRPGKACVALSVCGNSLRERGEQCDDGQATPVDGDGCSAKCQLESGFVCLTPGQACLATVCGNATRTPDEVCDDSNLVDGDGCSKLCQVEAGYRCSSAGCAAICGDGLLVAGEACDDGARVSGDGCSAACKVEPFSKCTASPSVCSSTILCGDSIVNPGELCDPPGVNGCEAGCKSFSPDSGMHAVCGDNIIEFGETCDGPVVPFTGCLASCLAEPGFGCPRPGECFVIPACGDGIVQVGEKCDVGAVSSAACVNCAVTPTWFCYGAGPSLCEQSVCGDATRAPDEECEDSNKVAGDGCTSCVVDTGWVCPTTGKPCVPKCGDGLVRGLEACDDGNTIAADGCSSTCRVEPGRFCAANPCVDGEKPKATNCGNGLVEGSEACDDGANDLPFDGCYECKKDPLCTAGICASTCGDGQRFADEQCDDGNTYNGDGCSSTCKTEDGFGCTDYAGTPPASIKLPVIFRDFIGQGRTAGGSTNHPDFNQLGGSGLLGLVKTRLTAQKKPDWAWVPYLAATGTAAPAASCTCSATGVPSQATNCYCDNPGHRYISGRANMSAPANFAQWYTNVPGVNVTMVTKLELPRVVATGQYIFDSGSAPNPGYMDPFNTGGWVALGKETMSGCSPDRNVSWTSETHFWFEYSGGERFDFSGDDDTWVFVDGQLVVDLGGLHGPLSGWFQLDADTDGAGPDTASGVAAVTQDLKAGVTNVSLGLVPGGTYEVVMFQAERNQCGSNFKVTLKDFNSPKSVCTPTCGDGKVVGPEVCDDGVNNKDGVYGACSTTCSERLFCGDGTKTTPNEACDNGKNIDTYDIGQANACGPGCAVPGKCGDSLVQGAFEVCDNGAANSDTSYGAGSCTKGCGLGGYCGDTITQTGHEACDNGAANVAYQAAPGACGYDCQMAPHCGDGLRNGPEECDDALLNGTAGSNCSASCKLLPYCGDGLVQSGELCDYGLFASNAYGGCTASCVWGPLCGDGKKDLPFEECDLGAGNNNEYNGCTASCTFGPRCGDGAKQASSGEACDNGFNDDIYQFSAESCASGCKLPPSCGDGVVANGYELCDAGAANSDSAYGGCTSRCDWGPYCGDAKLDATEVCDDGVNNRAYSPKGSGCGYDCRPAPSCGDGQRNGPEQCDLGKAKNTGAYGACNADCTDAPSCGDLIVQADHGEQCDDGPIGSLTCSVTCTKRGILK